MGNINSRHIRSENETKIPKHLQPLKRKQVNKTNSNNSTETISNDQKSLTADHKTLCFYPHHTLNPQFKWTTGRRFTTDTSSIDSILPPLPNDQTELDRQRVQIYIFRWAFESRHIVPPPIKELLLKGIRILDVSCGPGLYLGNPVMDMAQDFSESTFDSIDICNLLPKQQVKDSLKHQVKDSLKHQVKDSLKHKSSFNEPQQLLDNLTFTPHNVLKDGLLPFQDNTFNYTQQSLTTLVYCQEDWKAVLLDLKRVTKPGGYIQLLEIEMYPQPQGLRTQIWLNQVYQRLLDKRGIDVNIPRRLNQVLAELGLIEIETRFVSVPIGSWGLDIGCLWEQNLSGFFEAMGPFVVDLMETTNEQYKKDVEIFLSEAKDLKAFNNICIVWGRIPLE